MKQFKIGDEIICLDSYSNDGLLTYNKTYIVNDVDTYYVFINNDRNWISVYPIHKFISKQELRLIKLNRLFDENYF